MIAPYFIEHYNDRNTKVNNIKGDGLASVFDTYMSLFVIFNNLYNEIPKALIRGGIHVPKSKYSIIKKQPSMLRKLTSINGFNKAVAPLQVCYYVRCNNVSRKQKLS